MNLLKSPLRRTTAILAGAFIGLAGAAAFAAPASAHHPEVNPLSSCVNEDGSWQVKWTITNSESDLEAVVTEVNLLESDGASITGVAAGTELPEAGDGSIQAVESLPASADEAKLEIKAHWVRNGNPIDGTKYGVTGKPREVCAPTYPPTKPPATPTTPTTKPTPPTVPPTTAPATTAPPTTAPPTTPGEPASPTPIFEEDCTTITIGLENPADGIEITLKFKTSKGEQRTTVIAPGESKSEKFSATPGFTVDVTVITKEFGSETETVAYEQPEGCDNDGGGGLPVTGAAAGGIAGGAALLLAAGGGLVLMARRRKLKFTA